MKETPDWRFSQRSIRSRLTGIVLIPSVALFALWAGTSAISVYDGLYTRSVAVGIKDLARPAVDALAAAQRERTLSQLFLVSPDFDRSLLDVQRQRTDRALAAMRTASASALEQAPEPIRQRMAPMSDWAGELPTMRLRIDSRQLNTAQLAGHYNRFMDLGNDLFETQARIVPDQTASQSGLLASEIFRDADRASRAESAISVALETRSLSPEEKAAFARTVGAYRASLDANIAHGPPPVQEQYRRIISSDEWKKLDAYETRILAQATWSPPREGSRPVATPVSGQEWQATAPKIADELAKLAVAQADFASTAGVDEGNQALLEATLGSLLALLIGVAAFVLAARVARRIVRRLNGLRDETGELADRTLPSIVNRIGRGEQVETRAELPDLDYGTDEVGQVASAFRRAQETAIAAAVQQAQAREGANNVFLGIARRSQRLVHRQLQLLDQLERSVENPDQMDLLFRLDHLATGARRNAENLITLGGDKPGRKWTKPVPLKDVLRGAVTETKHYSRVRVGGAPSVSLDGAAVADVLHLIAELVDNATSFSPPHSRVTVQAELVAKGVVAEVEDRGLGMSDEHRDRANQMLAQPPAFDAMVPRDDSRLGLFVVAWLAAKHRVQVELRSSAYGGMRAIVLIPAALISDDRHVHGPAVSTKDDAAENFVWPEHLPDGDDLAEASRGVTEHPSPSSDEQVRLRLPQRRRQASLAPQLRGEVDTPMREEPGSARSAEEMRDVLSAFQRGTHQARESDRP